MLRINDIAPDFTADSTHGPIHFHQWIADSWAVLFSHPKDFTPVCTTELGAMARLAPEFAKRHCKIAGLSIDSVADHRRWMADIEQTQNCKVSFPMLADTDLKVSKAYNMLPAEASGAPESRSPSDNATVRTVFLISPDKKIRLMLVYPMATGRNFDEILRALDSLQLTAAHKIATPANWTPGHDVIISPSISDDEARQLYPAGFQTLRPYLRLLPQSSLPH